MSGNPERPPGSGPDSPRRGLARIRALARRVERWFVPPELAIDGSLDPQAVRLRYRRVVLSLCVVSVLLFPASYPVAGVPPESWLEFTLGAITVAVVIGASLLLVPPTSWTAPLTGIATALAIFALDHMIGTYYHQAATLFALAVAGHAIMVGFRSALAMVVAGAVLLPYVSVPRSGPTPGDALYAFIYLFGIAGILWTYRRLQERAAAALLDSQRRYRDLVERMPAAVYAARPGPNGAWTYVSPRIEAILGFPPEDWLNDADLWWSRLHPDDRARVKADEAISLEDAVRRDAPVEYRLIAADGSERWVRDEAALVPAGEGAGLLWSGTLLDVTAEKAYEAHLRQAQRMEAVGQLAGGIAHDFNNILTAIRGYAELLRDRWPGPAEDLDDFDQLLLAADRAATLVRQLLAFGRRQVLQPRVLEPAVVVDGLVPMLRRLVGEEIEIRTRHAPGTRHALFDASQLDQVIVNLVVNARDAMPEGGVLTITTSEVAASAPPAGEQPGSEPGPGPTVRLVVADTGHGMDDATLGRIFEPYFTTKDVGRGSGMGLATVYGIIEQSGGRISCESWPGEGTTFTIDLPLVAPAPSEEPEPDVRHVPHGPEVVLVAEDEPAVRQLAVRIVERLGYRVTGVEGGQAALQRLAEEPAIDLLLTDARMPDMRGPELARRARAMQPDLPVVVMSGYAGPDEGGDPADPDLPYFIAKPFDVETLARVLRTALDGPDAACLPGTGDGRPGGPVTGTAPAPPRQAG